MHAAAQRVRTLLDGHSLEREGQPTRPLEPSDVAVVCPHVNQASAIRALLSDVPEVIVGTANQLQGAERPAIVALHPLIGHRGVGPFAMELGRACVLLSRHSAHLTLVTDHEAIKAVVAASPTGTPGAAEHLHLLQALAELSEV
ncbi:AAA domain-containing protein [Embleya sp. NBC_00888]|uniref:AAA domain-containing protein n=1 Tax=Embleya sp. NBC_00888 TaxID=2975960 RepID=UPI002F90F0A7